MHFNLQEAAELIADTPLRKQMKLDHNVEAQFLAYGVSSCPLSSLLIKRGVYDFLLEGFLLQMVLKFDQIYD